MKLFDTATRKKIDFAPMDGRCARLYTCGPTVYNFAHIGNFRAYVFEDVLRRAIQLHGWQVYQVMNLTDVDDKTIRGSRAAGMALNDYTKPYIDAFFSDIQTLNIQRAEAYPAATDHVPEMIGLIQALFDRGLAYLSDDGSVYFPVAAFPGYGRPAHVDLSGMRDGARVAQDEYAKESVGDFALWKAWSEEDGDVAWDSPWGRGRPGWHIECSAMAMKYLGPTFDLHTGGIDNLFPHHANETAQSEGATGKPFARYWLHCAHLRVNGEKMSKSAGNFFTLRDLLEKGWGGREIRYVLLNCHYRQALNFTFDSLDAARAALARVDAAAGRLAARAAGAAPAATPPGWAANAETALRNALADDLNVPEALAALFTMVRDANAALDKDELEPAAAAAVLALLDGPFELGLGVTAFGRRDAEARIPDDVRKLADERAAARAAKNWAESDRLRAAIAGLGWTVRDTRDGQTLAPAQ
ncbi:MAG: cysteine--tRNA ligase [Kiritimatiellia bacterium]